MATPAPAPTVGTRTSGLRRCASPSVRRSLEIRGVRQRPERARACAKPESPTTRRYVDRTLERRYHVAVRAVILFFSLCLPAVADLAAGQRAFKNGDYATALKEFLPLAKQGNAVARGCSEAVAVYDEGRGVARDYKEAAKWYRLAAEQGNISAQVNLGVLYRRRPRCRAGLQGGREVVPFGGGAGRRGCTVQPRRHV